MKNTKMVTGILKNKNEALGNIGTQNGHIDENSSKDDLHRFRQQVYENTLLNAKLMDSRNHQDIRRLSSGGDNDEYMSFGDEVAPHRIPKDILQMRLEQEGKVLPLDAHNITSNDGSENIVWNKQNLAENEILKQQYQDIHVDEPKTPYQGAIDLQGEYYTVDDDEDEGLDGFSLGDPSISEPVLSKKDEENEEEVAEAPKKSFAELRKDHYKVGNALKHGKNLLNQD